MKVFKRALELFYKVGRELEREGGDCPIEEKKVGKKAPLSVCIIGQNR